MIAGIVLSAGRSSRMGQPKALLSLEGKSFLQRILEAMAAGGCESLVVVHGGEDQRGSDEMADLAARFNAVSVINPDPDSEQLDSIRLALMALPDDIEGAMVSPVDAPGITAGVVGGMSAAVRAGALISVAAWKGRRGHPIMFSGEALRALREDELEQGARSVLHRFEDRTVEVEGESEALLLDVDTPEEYRSITEVQP